MLCTARPRPAGLRALRDPDILWYYKWILEHLHEFPQVSKAQIEQTFRDMDAATPRPAMPAGAVPAAMLHRRP